MSINEPKARKTVKVAPKTITPLITGKYTEFPDFDNTTYQFLKAVYPTVNDENRFVLQEIYNLRNNERALKEILISGKDLELQLDIYKKYQAENVKRLETLAEIPGSSKGPICKNCDSDNTSVSSKQTRSLDEPETVMFICFNCGSNRN